MSNLFIHPRSVINIKKILTLITHILVIMYVETLLTQSNEKIFLFSIFSLNKVPYRHKISHFMNAFRKAHTYSYTVDLYDNRFCSLIN